jgi:hypothetical protein
VSLAPILYRPPCTVCKTSSALLKVLGARVPYLLHLSDLLAATIFRESGRNRPYIYLSKECEGNH